MEDCDFTPEMMEAMKAAGAPSEGHARLEPLVGEWDTETHMWFQPGADPMVTKGSATSTWVLGGRFLVETLHGAGPDGNVYEGRAIVGFNNPKARYEGIWISDGMSAMTTFTGESHPDADGIRYTGVECNPMGAGPDAEFVSERIFDGPDTNRFVMSYKMPDGSLRKSFEITYSRRTAG